MCGSGMAHVAHMVDLSRANFRRAAPSGTESSLRPWTLPEQRKQARTVMRGFVSYSWRARGRVSFRAPCRSGVVAQPTEGANGGMTTGKHAENTAASRLRPIRAAARLADSQRLDVGEHTRSNRICQPAEAKRRAARVDDTGLGESGAPGWVLGPGGRSSQTCGWSQGRPQSPLVFRCSPPERTEEKQGRTGER